MNGYIYFYNGKRVEIYAENEREAIEKARAFFNPPKSKRHMVHGMIAERNGIQVEHSTSELS